MFERKNHFKLLVCLLLSWLGRVNCDDCPAAVELQLRNNFPRTRQGWVSQNLLRSK